MMSDSAVCIVDVNFNNSKDAQKAISQSQMMMVAFERDGSFFSYNS